MARSKTITIDGDEFKLHSLTRGQVRLVSTIENEQEQADELVKVSLKTDSVDDVDMCAYRQLVDEIMSFNGLGGDAVDDAKKN